MTIELNQMIRTVEAIIPSKCDLSNEELVDLIQKGIDADKNMEILYAKNIRFILSVAKKYSKEDAEILDLMQEGFLGLYKAVQKYSIDHGTKFLTFAGWEIRSSIRKYVVNNCSAIRFTAHCQEMLYKYMRFLNKYIEETGEEPSDDLVKTTLQLTDKNLKMVKTCHQMSSCVSLNTSLQTDDKLKLQDILASEEDIEEEILSEIGQQELKKELWKEIDSLSSEDAFLVRQVFQNNKLITEIAPSLGISYQAASQRMQRILSQLQQNERIRVIGKIHWNIKTAPKEENIDSVEEIKTEEMVEFEKMFESMTVDIFKDLPQEKG